MIAIQNTIEFFENNWLNLILILGVIGVAIERCFYLLSLSKEKKIELILKTVRREILALMSQAEVEWSYFSKSGEIKKAQVISKIYEKFPILAEYINQDKLVSKISKMIEDEKSNMDKIINKKNSDEK